MNAPNRCALSSWPTGWRGWLLLAVLAVWWAGVSVGEWVLDKWGEK